MFIPRFSIRLLLTLTAACAVVFLVARFAALGQTWAVAILVGVAAVGALFGLFAVMFAVAYFLSTIGSQQEPAIPESPFAQDRLPPQVIPPVDVD